MRVAVAVLVAGSALLLAGCGSEGTVQPTAQAVEGTLPTQQTTAPTLAKGDPAAGKKVFAAQGCGGCHTFTPAGSKGQIGPDLDNLAADAKKAGVPLDQYIKDSIVDPDKYIVPGYQKGVMPTNFGQSLGQQGVQALVQYLQRS